jgi:hypothetical protein
VEISWKKFARFFLDARSRSIFQWFKLHTYLCNISLVWTIEIIHLEVE